MFPAGTPAGIDLERMVRNRIAELARIRLGSISCAPSGELMAVSASAGKRIFGGMGGCGFGGSRPGAKFGAQPDG
jgi:hypothetical protein